VSVSVTGRWFRGVAVWRVAARAAAARSVLIGYICADVIVGTGRWAGRWIAAALVVILQQTKHFVRFTFQFVNFCLQI
jgi:hypothetical protein